MTEIELYKPPKQELKGFRELYDEYYKIQIGKTFVKPLKTGAKLQTNILNKLEAKTKKQLKGKKALDISPKDKNIVSQYDNVMQSAEEDVELQIKDFLEKYMQTDAFGIDATIWFNKESEDSNNFFMSIANTRAENFAGLYYLLHNTIPRQEFFGGDAGFALHICSLIPRVEETIEHIRKNHGIKRPRALVKTLTERGRHEKEGKLSYLNDAENEIYDFVKQYMQTHFSMEPPSKQTMVIAHMDKEQDEHEYRLFQAGKEEHLFIRGTEDVKKYSPEQPFIDRQDASWWPNITSEGIENIAANMIDVFAKKGLAEKIQINYLPKYF